MIRTTPVAQNEEIELYIRTYYSLLRSSEPIRIRSLEETHAAMNSSLHQQASSSNIDCSALIYAALRLPDCIIQSELIVMGQMEDVFRRAGYMISQWEPVKARARRRKLYYNAADKLLAAYIASVSDIDDFIPCITTLQIEWNKLHYKLNSQQLHQLLVQVTEEKVAFSDQLLEQLRLALDLTTGDFDILQQAWRGPTLLENLHKAATHKLDMRVKVLGSGLSDYRRSVQYWWGRVEQDSKNKVDERPIYFVSSNTHSMVNLLTGLAWDQRQEIIQFVQQTNPENLWSEYQRLPANDHGHLRNFLYYVLRQFAVRTATENRLLQREQEVGITRSSEPHCLDVEAQIIEIRRINPAYVDPRVQLPVENGWQLLQESDALIFNIDYPLGMAAYHIFNQVSTAVDGLQGVYILGKAATLNGRVGDVMIPNVVYDEHSRNSYLFRNCFAAQDIAPFLNFGTVFDNQKAVTVRGTILQNRHFMHVFYEEGYTDIEMESGPYLSGIYEDVYPRRYPTNEIVNLFINAPYDIGLIHYASDTPISRRQSLLSKSLSYFGVDATYAATIAVLQRILTQEVERQRNIRMGSLRG